MAPDETLHRVVATGHRGVPSPVGVLGRQLSPALQPTPGCARSVAQFTFTGREREYFRIWVVNLLLTLLTLGAYSAWAKVRRTQYFWQNTRLDGFAFEYHANPWAILRGRIVALALASAYTWAFDFSRTAGLITLSMLCAVGPWLFMKAQQFKLHSTRWRGLRFGFEASTSEAFRVILPILLVWLSSTFAGVWLPELWLPGFMLVALLCVPWMHHRLKAYQHRRACYGDRAFSFAPAPLRFYAIYAKGFLLLLVGSVLGVGATVLLVASFSSGGKSTAPTGVEAGIYAVPAILAVYLFVWPFLAARLQQAVWSATRLGDVGFRTEIRAGALSRLAFRNVLLTLATLGLYWPLAAVALARYRIECMRIEAASPISALAAGTQSSAVSATGDAAADAFGIDIGV